MTNLRPTRIVVVGASAGGVDAVSTFVGALPADLAAPVLVVLHIPTGSYSALPDILNRVGPLPAGHVTDGEALVDGRLYAAPPDHHLMVDDGHIHLDSGPLENCSRPSIDHLFSSAASAYGPAAVAVVLSGMLQDGTVGMRAVLAAGGRGLVQDPTTAAFPSMPTHAAPLVDAECVLSLDLLGAEVGRLIRTPLVEGAA